MKKLMIAMSAAAMMSLCAQAAVPEAGADTAYGKSLGTGTDFDSYAGAWDPTKDDNGTSNGKVYWTGGSGESSSSEIKVKNDQAQTPDKYLKVDETEELTRLIDVNGGVASNATVSADSSIYFSSQVQFTAMDADNVPAVSNGVDKIIVWAKAPDEEQGGTTNLMVTAWDAAGIVTNVDTEITIDAETWYDLEIVASPSAQGSVSPISFMVKLGDRAAVGPFLSMVDAETEGATTISSASFKGTGAVDEIDWGTVAAAEPVDVTLDVRDDIQLFDYDTQTEYDESTVSGVPGSTVKILVEAPASGYTVTGTGATIADGEGDYGDFAVITITVAANLTVTIAKAGDVPQPVEVDFTLIPEGAQVENLAQAYYVGDSIVPNNLIPTPSSPYKRATVTVKVNGDVITEAYTLKANDVLLVEVTEEDITFALTIPEVTGASASVTTGGVQVADLTAILTGTVVTVTWTPDSGKKITAGATEEITMTESKTAATPTVATITYATLTITPVENCTIVVKNGDDTVATGAQFDVDEAVRLTVTRTPAQGYRLDNCVAEETITMSEDRTVTAAVVQSSGDFVPNYIAGKSQETIDKYKTWAATYGDDTQSANEEAYLLNCAPNAQAVAAAKAAFKFTSITPGVIPTIDGSGYNGVVVILGGTSLSNIATWDKATTTDTFFKATLVVEETND